MNYNEMLDYIYELRRFGIKLGLEPMKKALKAFDNPHNDLRFIHITGTNGKGSAAAMLNSILRTAGYKVGMFTSPHLVDFRERIQVDSGKIDKMILVEICNDIFEKDLELTFFEFITLVSFLYFKRMKVDYVVLEVGLGGTYDATNIVESKISAITNIALDHTHILGNDVETIARDKCGIIKENSIVVTTKSNWQVLPIIKSYAKEKHAKLEISETCNSPLALKGDFQKDNAGIVVKVAELLGVSEENIRTGLINASWPGRVEYIEENVILDGAHNEAAIKALSQYISTLDYDNLILVFGVTEHKDYKAMLELMPNHRVIFTQAKVSRSLEISEVNLDCEKNQDPAKAFERAKKIASKYDLILVTGSLYLVGNFKEIYQKEENVMRVAM